jgi:hypothetical protein
MLLAAPTGISWSTLGNSGGKPDPQQQLNEQLNLCDRATSMINGYANQPLRATVDTETLYGPGDFRWQMRPYGISRLLLSRSPVTSVISGQISPAAYFPASWSPIPATGFQIERPVIGVYGTTSPGGSGDGGQSVLMGPFIGSWCGGTSAWQVQVTYINGWPHGSLQVAAEVGDMQLTIDDCTGWGPPAGLFSGAAGTLHDPGTQEEFQVLSATAPSGPGILTLARPLNYPHTVGVMATTLPATITQAAILFAVSQALVRGATASTIQALPGTGSGAGKSPAAYAAEAELLVHPYRRVI